MMNVKEIARDFNHFLQICAQPIDPKYIKKREGWRDRNGNSHMVNYVEWMYVADFLDAVAPTWSHSVENVALIGDIITVTVSITVFGVTRQGLGTGSAESEMGIKKAEHDALKRAAVKFGIARELYSDDDDPTTAPSQRMERPEVRQPFVDSVQHKDICTIKQLGLFEKLCRNSGKHPNDVVKELYGNNSPESMMLSREGCSRAIDYIQQQKGVSA